MRQRNKAGGKAVKTQRRKTLKRRNAPKTTRRRNSLAVDATRGSRGSHASCRGAGAADGNVGDPRRDLNSPTDLAPVFNAILANATRLCEGNLAALWRYDGKFLIRAAQYRLRSIRR